MLFYDYVKESGRSELLLEWDQEANADLDPAGISAESCEKIRWVCEKGHHWVESLSNRLIDKTGCPYCSGMKTIPGMTDLASTNPEVASLWHPEKNGRLTPKDVSPMSHKTVWWQCEQGHEWEARVYSLVDGSRCPYCSGYKPLTGKTDIATTHPELMSEWDYEKNTLTPQEVSKGSRKMIYWKCEKGHSYGQVVYTRVAGSGCPYCAGKKVLPGFNDLATTDPKIAAECVGGDPTQVTRSSHKLLRWKCALGHEYEAAPYTRISGSGCPYCSGRKALAGFNDLATVAPKVAAQWNTALNGALTPEMVTKGSNQKVWWSCSEGHVWQAVVFSRTRKKASDCPICAGTVKTRFKNRYKADGEAARPLTIGRKTRVPDGIAV